MKYTTLGSSGIHVSQLCVGCMSFGDPASNMHAGTLDPAQSEAIIRHALDLGINFFDTAELYPVPPAAETYASTEEMIGAWLHERKCRNDMSALTSPKAPSNGMLRFIRSNFLFLLVIRARSSVRFS